MEGKTRADDLMARVTARFVVKEHDASGHEMPASHTTSCTHKDA
jgi:hypothetical protein